MLRKRKKVDYDGCLEVESNARSGDIANAGFCVQNGGKQTQMEVEPSHEQADSQTDPHLELFEEGEDEVHEEVNEDYLNNDGSEIDINL